jgi:hypothetical protein
MKNKTIMTFHLADVAKAHDLIESRQAQGKLGLDGSGL